MAEVITLSIKDQAASKIIDDLKNQGENISEIFCNLLLKEYNKSKQELPRIKKSGGKQ